MPFGSFVSFGVLRHVSSSLLTFPFVSCSGLAYFIGDIIVSCIFWRFMQNVVRAIPLVRTLMDLIVITGYIVIGENKLANVEAELA
jgi:hypothetical protein